MPVKVKRLSGWNLIASKIADSELTREKWHDLELQARARSGSSTSSRPSSSRPTSQHGHQRGSDSVDPIYAVASPGRALESHDIGPVYDHAATTSTAASASAAATTSATASASATATTSAPSSLSSSSFSSNQQGAADTSSRGGDDDDGDEHLPAPLTDASASEWESDAQYAVARKVPTPRPTAGTSHDKSVGDGDGEDDAGGASTSSRVDRGDVGDPSEPFTVTLTKREEDKWGLNLHVRKGHLLVKTVKPT
jgi:hypothetical protein